MNSKTLLTIRLQSLAVGLWIASAVAAADSDDVLALVNAGKPACTIVVVTDGKSDTLLKRSAEPIAETIKLWSGVELPTATLSDSNRELPAESAIVLTTLDALKKLAPEFVASQKELTQAATMNEGGFVCVPRTAKNAKQLLVVSRTPRGVYNGAVYVRDFCIDGTKQNLNADFRSVARSPQMTGRPVYTLTIWAQESQYTAADWATVFQSFARDGVDTVYFWVSGHFPSKQFPQTYKCKNVFDGKLYDTTEETKIGTVQDIKDIVASAHKLGLKIYLGGALGGWCGTQFLTNSEPDTFKIGPKEPSLCPSNPKCRKALVAYYDELFAAIPEADGLFIESADEFGDCKCDLCSKPVDTLGSKQFGQSQLSLCQEIMSGIWRDHPQAHFAYTIGYQEHAKDVAYYRLIQQLSNDPRFEWMESRKSWTFPGPKGEARPASFFSKKFMHWNQDANTPLETIIENANRAKAEGMSGLVTCFSPGFDSGVFYKQVPIPTDALPQALTGFVYREATWNPDLTIGGMNDLVQKRFFGKEAPKNLGDDLRKLREIMRKKRGVEQLAAIEQHIQEAQSNAGPKTQEGLKMMTRAVDDIHKYVSKKKPN